MPRSKACSCVFHLVIVVVVIVVIGDFVERVADRAEDIARAGRRPSFGVFWRWRGVMDHIRSGKERCDMLLGAVVGATRTGGTTLSRVEPWWKTGSGVANERIASSRASAMATTGVLTRKATALLLNHYCAT